MNEPQQMPAARPELHVLDVPDLGRYEARLGPERELAGLLDYRLASDFIVLTHTEVLEGFEGQGLGSRLVRAVLEDLRERQVAVIPRCPFVVAWLQKHPEQHDILFRPLDAPEPDEPSGA
jgi:predicted GNAT family acetyltransferase